MSDLVRKPGAPTDAEGSDLLAPTKTYLNKLGLLPDEAKPERTEGKRDKEDNSLQVTQSAKTFATIATGVGGGGSILAGILAAAKDESDVVVAALAVATAIIIAAGIYGVARVTDGDVRGRSSVATAAMNARAAVAQALLESFDAAPASRGPQPVGPSDSKTQPTEEALQLLAALVACGVGAKVTCDDGADVIEAFRWTHNDGLEVKLKSAEDYVATTRIKRVQS